MGWGQLKLSAGLLAGFALAACASTPEEAAKDPLVMCEAMSAGDEDLAGRLSRSGSEPGDFCACFVQIETGLDAGTRAETYALMSKVIDMRAGTDRSTEDVAELLEDDRDGSLYGFPEERLKRGAQPIEDALSRARRNPESCRAS
jgi:hypothetical protein